MKRFVKIVFLGLVASALSLPAIAESALAGTAGKGTRVTAKLDFSIVVLPSLSLRVRTAPRPATTETAFTVRVEANGGSVSVLSTVAGPAGADNRAMTLAANRKLVRAESPWNPGSPERNMTPLADSSTHLQRRDPFTYTVAQL